MSTKTKEKAVQEKTCPECGVVFYEQTESYFMECERCLATKPE